MIDTRHYTRIPGICIPLHPQRKLQHFYATEKVVTSVFERPPLSFEQRYARLHWHEKFIVNTKHTVRKPEFECALSSLLVQSPIHCARVRISSIPTVGSAEYWKG